MPKLRYAIAAIFFAASVSCLALWWRSLSLLEFVNVPLSANHSLDISSFCGLSEINVDESRTQWLVGMSRRLSPAEMANARRYHTQRIEGSGRFGLTQQGVYFPAWYASLIFALAGVAVLRFRRQFSIRSAMIGLAVVAALLGMVVML